LAKAPVIVLKDTGVTLKTVLASLAEGATTAEILADFPTLSEEDVRAIAFAAASAQEDLPSTETPVCEHLDLRKKRREPRRHDANGLPRLSVQGDRFADDRRAPAEPRLPQLQRPGGVVAAPPASASRERFGEHIPPIPMKPAHDGTAQKGETSMKNRISNGIAVMAVAMIAICAAAPEAFGQNMQASNLTLKKTYVVTHTTPTLIYGQNWGGSVLFASGTIVTCPKGANCFLKVDVTLQASVSPGESLFLYGRVDYNDSAPQVAQVISGVIPNGFSETRSYSWFFEVPQGDHVVDVLTWTLNDLGATMERGSLTISVFR
jgi:hypothetical protein